MFGWNRPLERRRGSPKRLDGLDIYYDFNWMNYFPDGRAQFKNGQCLARLARGDCPPGKAPALLLTDQPDIEEKPIETDSHFAVVVNLPRYLQQATADAAASYYAHHLESGITSLAQLRKVAARPDVIRAVIEQELDAKFITEWVSEDKERLDELHKIVASKAGSDAIDVTRIAARTDVIKAVVEDHLTIAHIASWVNSHPEQLQQLQALAQRDYDVPQIGKLDQALVALDNLVDLDDEIIQAIASLLGRTEDREARLTFLHALTADRTGRAVTSEVLGQRITDRLVDAREATEAYSDLIRDPQASETDLQKFIEAHPWLLGLEYVRIRPRHALPRGVMDFVLERYDGFHDFLELKNPQDAIVVAPDESDGLPPPASSFSLSADLAQALAQAHVYRDVLTTDAPTLDRLYGLSETRDPRVTIVIGQAGQLPPHRQRVLRQLNLSLHRVEVVPYDVLADRTTTVLDNVKKHLSASS